MSNIRPQWMKYKCGYFLSLSVLRVKCLWATASPESPWSFDGLPPFLNFLSLSLAVSHYPRLLYRELLEIPLLVERHPSHVPGSHFRGTCNSARTHTHQRSLSTRHCKNKAKKHLLQPTALREGNTHSRNEPKMPIWLSFIIVKLFSDHIIILSTKLMYCSENNEL